MMLFYNIKLAMCNLLKNKTVAIINVVGLSVGITVSLLIFSFVRKEIATDKFIPHVENIYILSNKGEYLHSYFMINTLKDAIPEVDNITFCSFDWSPQVFLATGQSSFKVEKLLTADSCFFRVFHFKPIWGDPANALNTANKLVITQSLAKKIFGIQNPVGKTLTYNATYLQGEILEIGAVIEDMPQNSSWDFEAVLSFQTNFKIDWYVDNMNLWGAQNYSVFIRINENVSPNMVLDKLSSLSFNNIPDYYRQNLSFGLFPFNDNYFNKPDLDLLKHGNRLTLSIIHITGILILLLAYVNYINMVTAQRVKRHKNVGIIKTLGGKKKQIIELFVAESALVLAISTVISILIAGVLLEKLNSLTNSKFTIQSILSGSNLTVLTMMFISSLIVTGVVPGYFLSKYRATLILKNQTDNKRKGFLRNGLLVFQFTVSIALISGILLIHRQNSYMRNYNYGFDKENIIYAHTNDDIYDNIGAFKNELKKIHGVVDFTFSQALLGYNKQNWGIPLINNGVREIIHFSKMSVSPNFFDFLNIKLMEGKTFNENSNKNQDIILNETAIRSFNIINRPDARVDFGDPGKGLIIGIVEGFNFESLHVPVRPLGFMSSNDCDDVLYIKINTQNITSFQNTVKDVEVLWNKFSPNFPMEYHYFDESWNALYAKDQQFQSILVITTIISLILSCLGLFGLTLFVTERRTKEIGIRKVNGAKVWEVIAMLNIDFVKWVAIAFVIATPIAWYAMNRWLQNFAYKTELNWWIFALAGVLALGVALITVSWQSWRTARRNPVEALRYE